MHLAVQTALLLFGVADAAAPHATVLFPAQNSHDVPPGRAVLSVTFDQEMADGFSLAGGPRAVPRLLADPIWTDARTLEVQVELRSDRDYAIWLNWGEFVGFRSSSGETLEPLLWRFSTAPDGAPRDHMKQVARLGDLLRDRYPHDVNADAMWRASVVDLRALATAPSARAFGRSLARSLGVLGDEHVTVRVGRHEYPSFLAPLPADTPSLIRGAREVSTPSATVGRIGSRGIVVALHALDRQALTVAHRAFKKHFSAADGPPGSVLILDVRGCVGGSEWVASELMGCFLAPGPVPYARTERVWDAGEWRGPFDRVLAGRPGCDWMASVPTLVLQDRGSRSSAEALLMMAAAMGLPRWGDGSAGSSGRPAVHHLGGGVRVMIPTWVDADVDGTPIQGHGVAPDQVVPADSIVDAVTAWVAARE